MKLGRLMIQLVIVAAISISLGLLSQSSAFAARACQDDIAKFCQGAQGAKQEMECLKQNREQLSPQCKRHMVQMMKAVKGVHQDCEADIETFCQNVKPGGGGIMKCLKAHRGELSPGCKEGMMGMLKNR